MAFENMLKFAEKLTNRFSKSHRPHSSVTSM